MNTISIPVRAEDAERLRAIARRENRSVEDVLHSIIQQHVTASRLEIPTEYLRKLFSYARKYWREHGEDARASLTDEQLHEQFWCIDAQGVPRLDSDRGSIQSPKKGGLVEFLTDIWAENPDSEVDPPIDYRKVLNEEFPEYLFKRMQRDNE